MQVYVFDVIKAFALNAYIMDLRSVFHVVQDQLCRMEFVNYAQQIVQVVQDKMSQLVLAVKVDFHCICQEIQLIAALAAWDVLFVKQILQSVYNVKLVVFIIKLLHPAKNVFKVVNNAQVNLVVLGMQKE
jgi:hypothetical protein